MKILVFLSFLCIVFTEALIYYISPDNEPCIVNGSTAPTPCFSFQELCEDRTLLSNKTQLILLLLPGTHVIPHGHNLSVSDVQVLDILSWNAQQEVEVKCERQAEIIFRDIGELEISLLNFTFCNIHGEYTRINTRRTVKIHSCIFAESREKYALTFKYDVIMAMNMSIHNCTFMSNNGGILCIGYQYKEFSMDVSDTVFINNWRSGVGGALHMTYVKCRLQRSQFVLNEAASGGAIYLVKASLLIAHTEFKGNIATDPKSGKGGAIYASQSYDLVTVHSIFLENAANESGGACSFHNMRSIITISHSHFRNNLARKGGGAIVLSSLLTDLELNNSMFVGNAAKFGGAIFNSGKIRIVNSQFNINVAGSGGAIYSSEMKGTILRNDSFKNNFAKINGGAVYDYSEGIVTFEIHGCQFESNFAKIAGGVLYYIGSYIAVTISHATFEYNQAEHGGAIYIYRHLRRVGEGGHVFMQNGLNFVGNKAADGGAMYAVNSILTLDSANTTMANNSALIKGGALFLDNSNIQTSGESQIRFYKNTVTSSAGKGGAIFVLDSDCYNSIISCFLDVQRSNLILAFNENIATYGSVLYGGLLDRCDLNVPQPKPLAIDYFKNHSQYEPLTPSAISSDPVQVCLCINSTQPNCNLRELTNITKMRGETVELALVVVDQDKNPLLSIVRAFYNERQADVNVGEGRRPVRSQCTRLSYHVFTSEPSVTMVLEPVGICERAPFSIFTIHITLFPCIRGFQLSKDRCVCERRITEYFGNNVVCDINTQSIKKEGSIWLRYDEQHLQLQNTCPLDYCNVTSDTISLLSPDEQCANHRSGVICGACQGNHSIGLGGNKCLYCTSNYTFIWLTLVFAAAGVALVTLLLVCNMTISTGTLNGLIFYANVVSISGLTSLQNCSIHPMLSVFLAWLNLDFGVETCFYPGMDTYQKTWLQFAFPLYIWLLVVAIIVASYYSSTAMKVFGRNNIAILATLFLLSYSKILKTIVTALSVTQILVGSAENVSDQLVPHKVWTHDGNIEYLKGKHMALFTVSLLFLFLLFLPYTMLLILGQCVRSMSVRRCWVLWCIRSTAFISIMDAYHAPYHRRHRYWTGLLLLARCILLLVFAADNRTIVNVYATTLTGIIILCFKTFSIKMHENFYFDILEYSFHLNLVILSSTLSFMFNDKASVAPYARPQLVPSQSHLLFLLAYFSIIFTSDYKTPGVMHSSSDGSSTNGWLHIGTHLQFQREKIVYHPGAELRKCYPPQH
jgi:hypothetical protein